MYDRPEETCWTTTIRKRDLLGWVFGDPDIAWFWLSKHELQLSFPHYKSSRVFIGSLPELKCDQSANKLIGVSLRDCSFFCLNGPIDLSRVGDIQLPVSSSQSLYSIHICRLSHLFFEYAVKRLVCKADVAFDCIVTRVEDGVSNYDD